MRIDLQRFRVPASRQLSLSRFDPTDTAPFETKEDARKLLAKSVHHLYGLTELLAAQSRRSVLFILQAMDGAGKDSAVKHVMRGLDPKVTQVFAFKAPSAEELRHDFMWRCMKALPERGRIGIFNRSYYEDVLVPQVNPEALNGQVESGNLEIAGQVVIRPTDAFSADIVLERTRGDLSVTDESGTQALGLTDLRVGLNAQDGVWNFTAGLAGQQLGVLGVLLTGCAMLVRRRR